MKLRKEIEHKAATTRSSGLTPDLIAYIEEREQKQKEALIEQMQQELNGPDVYSKQEIDEKMEQNKVNLCQELQRLEHKIEKYKKLSKRSSLKISEPSVTQASNWEEAHENIAETMRLMHLDWKDQKRKNKTFQIEAGMRFENINEMIREVSLGT